jgi:spore germination protein
MKRAWLISMIVSALVFSVGLAPVAAAPAELASSNWHWVQPGETIFSIGRLYGVNPWTISAANRLANPNRIYAGQHLYIPAGNGYPPPCGSYYWVKPGDSLHSIGRAYGVSPWFIASANGIYNLNWIYAGQRLWIPCH